MLLAAGHGRRMEPLSTAIAKPALEVLGCPLLAAALRQLERAGCARIAVNLHRHPDQVAAAVRAAATVPVGFSWEPELLGGAGGIAAARGALGDGAVLVANADVWADLDLGPLLRAPAADVAVLALLPHPDPARWASVALDGGGAVTAIVPPGAPYAGERYLFTGFQLLGAEVVAGLPAPPAEMAAVWEPLRRRGALRGAVVAGRWREAGSPLAYRDLVAGELGERSWVHPGAGADGATVERSAVGTGCRVDPGAAVIGCVLTRGATVAAGCDLRGCVIAGTAVPAGAALADTLVVPGARVPLV